MSSKLGVEEIPLGTNNMPGFELGPGGLHADQYVGAGEQRPAASRYRLACGADEPAYDTVHRTTGSCSADHSQEMVGSNWPRFPIHRRRIVQFGVCAAEWEPRCSAASRSRKPFAESDFAVSAHTERKPDGFCNGDHQSRRGTSDTRLRDSSDFSNAAGANRRGRYWQQLWHWYGLLGRRFGRNRAGGS